MLFWYSSFFQYSRVILTSSGVIKDSGPAKGDQTSCDEYPFASTVEGGDGAHIKCVVARQNSIQGGQLWGRLQQNLNYGDRFVVRIKGIECSNVQESDLQSCGGSRKRQFSGYGGDPGLLDDRSGTEGRNDAI